MIKLCVILNTSYDYNSHTVFNSEIEQDLRTIKSTLDDHHFLVINIPVTAKMLMSTKIIQKQLALLNLREIINCHIVLNTHGTPGYSDIKLECIIYLVKLFTQMNISISQISALMCDGMQSATLKTNATMQVLLPDTPKKEFFKEAFLINLQKKLNTLTLEREQNFHIHGFNYAYDPQENMEDVINTLKAKSCNSLAVSIKKATYSEQDISQILLHIDTVKSQAKMSLVEYQTISNLFASLLNYMKQHIFIKLKYKQCINDNMELIPLCNALTKHIKLKNIKTQGLTENNLNMIYRSWIKEYKLNSVERLDVLMAFTQIFLNEKDITKSKVYLPAIGLQNP